LKEKNILNPKLSNPKVKRYFTYITCNNIKDRERGMKWEFPFITELELLSSTVEESP